MSDPTAAANDRAIDLASCNHPDGICAEVHFSSLSALSLDQRSTEDEATKHIPNDLLRINPQSHTSSAITLTAIRSHHINFLPEPYI